jgi:hypothetical protein
MKGGEAGFVVLTVESCLIPPPPPKGSFHRNLKEAGTRAGLEAHPSDNLTVSGTRLVFQEEEIFEQRKVGGGGCQKMPHKDGQRR